MPSDPWESAAGAATSAAAQAAKNPWEATSFVAAQPEPEQAPDSHWKDFLKSIPRGALESLSASISASGQAEASQQGFAEEIPDAGQTEQALETNVTGSLHKPQSNWGGKGEAVGNALGDPISYIGPGGLGIKVGGSVLSSLASEEAGELTKGSRLEPWARAGAGILTGGLTGLAGAERTSAKLLEKLPSAEKIKDAGSAGYDALKTSNTRIDPAAMSDLHSNITAHLNEEWFDPELAPHTNKIVSKLADEDNASVRGLVKARKLLGNVSDSNKTDQAAASQVMEAIDFFMENSVPDESGVLKHANTNWAAYRKYKQVEKALSVGENRAGVSGTGANVQNTMRQEIRKILDSDRKARGFSPQEKDLMEQIVNGTVAANTARWMGRFAPTGLLSSSATLFTSLYNAPLAVGVAGAGLAAKKLGDLLTARQIKQLADSIRARSAIGKPVAREIAPKLEEQRMVPAAGATRADVEQIQDQSQKPPGTTMHPKNSNIVPDPAEQVQ